MQQAQSVVALTGAGISAESGIPTFRGPGGLWRDFKPEQLATPEAFSADPELVWEWYEWRRCLIAAAQPNAGHLALAAFERRAPDFVLVTQNVDGLHDRAGSERVVKLHGDIWIDRCVECDGEETVRFDNARVVSSHLCGCGGLLRPGVVWFGEALPLDAWHSAEQAVRRAEVVLVVGTSSVVYPAAGLVPLAKSAGAKVIEVNPEETAFSGEIDCCLRGKAGEILPALLG
ncbi:MAG: NAD-dependent deacylase [Bryobacteraceae bacterium]